MSEYQIDTDWWMASDGKWYPPELHPDAEDSTAARTPSAGIAGMAPDADFATTEARAAPSSSQASGEAPRRVDPNQWMALRMAAENAGLAAQPHHRIDENWDWRQHLGIRATKGVRSELTGFTLFAWSVVSFLIGIVYLLAVVHDHANKSYMLMSPAAGFALLPWFILRTWQGRRSKASLGALQPQYSRRQMRWLRIALYVSVVGGVTAAVAFGIYWGFQLDSMLP